MAIDKLTREEFIAKYFPRKRPEYPGIQFTILPVTTSISDEEIERADTVAELRGMTLLRYAQMLQGFQETVTQMLMEIERAEIAEKIILSVN